MSFSTLPLGRSGGDFFWQGRRKNSVSCLEKERLIINSPALYFNNCGCLFSLCELSICSNVPFPWQLASKREASAEQNPRNYLNKWAFFCLFLFFFPLRIHCPFKQLLPSTPSSAFLSSFLLPLSLSHSLLISLYLFISAARRHGADTLTRASGKWVSLPRRLHSVLGEIPSVHTHTHTLVDTHMQTHHFNTQTGRLRRPKGLVLVNYSVCVGGFMKNLCVRAFRAARAYV